MSGRLPHQAGEWIDRERTLRFRFEGRDYDGYAGDTISSALLANGVRLLGRGFKYHRPRGVYSMANHDANVLMEDGARTHIRADVTPLRDGADLRAVNTFGGVVRDRARFLGLLDRFMPVGFYYKAFHTPRGWFPFYERRIRAMAGLGAVDASHARVRTPKAYDFCDVLVVGAGPAGMAAAAAAAESGARVVLVDENPRAGGTLGYRWAARSEGAAALDRLLGRLAALPDVDLRLSTVAAGCYADGWVALVDDRRMVTMRAGRIVVATGCIEQPAVFGNNDLPGVMLASAAQRLIHRYAVKPCERAVVFAANADGYDAATDLVRCGIQVRAIVDPRPGGEPTASGDAARDAGIPVHAGHAVVEAVRGPGEARLRSAAVAPLDEAGRPDAARGFAIPCDGIAMSVGWAPADGLIGQAGGRMAYSDRIGQHVPAELPPGLFVAGRANGVFPLEGQIADGERAGRAAAGAPVGPEEQVAVETACRSHPYPIFPHASEKCFVDLDEDVQYKDLVHAAQEGFDSIELMKRYSTHGMGPSQGKTANMNAIRILARLKGRTVAEVGVTTARPFVYPVPLGHLAGRGFHPYRLTPMHARHRAAGAEFMDAGEWIRPAFYRVPGVARDDAIAAEVRAVRTAAGLIDVGTLGKIEVHGPDAAEFVERLYTGRFARMKPGALRYGLMCDEAGVVIDDGVVARLAEDRFYVTTTTTASGPVYREMQRWAILWGLEVALANVTGAYAAMNLAGPRARAILAPLTDLALAGDAFPYSGVREAEVFGVFARVLRVGFVGELGYEIHVPASSAPHIWDAIAAAGARPFGVEAQRILRLEKGHAIVGQDTDGLTTPFDAGMAWTVKADKPFFVGQRSLSILSAKPPGRRLVGFTLPAAGPVPRECHLVIDGAEIGGRVTSVAFSPTLERVIGLAYVSPARAAPGTPMRIRVDDGRMVDATVAETPFYDPGNLRQNLGEAA